MTGSCNHHQDVCSSKHTHSVKLPEADWRVTSFSSSRWSPILRAPCAAQDLARAWKAAEQMEYGMIGINETGMGSEVAPFGGLKHSGLGKELSKYGIEEFLSIKYCCFNVGYNKSL